MNIKVYICPLVAIIGTISAGQFPVELEIENKTQKAMIFASLKGSKQEIEPLSVNQIIFDGQESHLITENEGTVYCFYSQQTASCPAVYAKKLGDESGRRVGMLIKPSIIASRKFVVRAEGIMLACKEHAQAY